MSNRNSPTLNSNKPTLQMVVIFVAQLSILLGLGFATADTQIAQPAYAQSLYPKPLELESSNDAAIIGGSVAEPDAWPWVVALVKTDIKNNFWSQYCAGALIAPDWVMTAAHCTYLSGGEAQADEIQVLFTSSALGDTSSKRANIKQIVRYPDFRRQSGDADLALLQLAQPVDRPTVQIIDHDDSAAELSGRSATVIGWGRTEELFRSDNLREVEVPLVASIECLNAYTKLNHSITANMLCAGYSQGGKDACTGDSGGPLVTSRENSAGEVSWTVVGVVSWGKDCAKPDAYGVYTKVSRFSSWIQLQAGLSDSNPSTTLAPTTTLLPSSENPELGFQIYSPYISFY